VADERGQLKVVASVELDETFTKPEDETPKNEIQKKVEEEVVAAEKHLDDVMERVMGRAQAQKRSKHRAAYKVPTNKTKAKKVEIPLDVMGAQESL
jgi:hypothetical protein